MKVSAAICMGALMEFSALGAGWASPQGSGLNLLSCMVSTDERLAECDVRGFSIADPAALEETLSRSHFELEDQGCEPPAKHHGVWRGLKRFSRFVFRGFRHYFVPKARAFLCMDQEDEYVRPSESSMKKEIAWAKTYPALSLEEFQIDPSWAFGWNRGDNRDVQERAWQRGHDRVTTPISLEPDLKTDHYCMSLDVRF